MDSFSPTTRRWFEQTFDGPTAVQARGWPRIAAGQNTLLLAPTGSGKTLAAFLSAIDRLGQLPLDAPPGVRVLYVSPLKALVYDVDRNLRSPLVGVRRAAELAGETLRDVGVDVRTGDTPQEDRRRQARRPSDILVTTPESLFLLLGSRARETLRTVETVIVDEIHALAPTKRGAHLALSLERLSELCERDPQRLGLSATVRPAERIARFLGGDREVDIVDASAAPHLDLRIVVPVPDMENPPAVSPLPKSGGDPSSGDSDKKNGTIVGDGVGGAPVREERGLWPSIYPELVDLIREHRSTILFVNSRGLCERLSQRLNDLAGEPLVRAHHGSVSHEERAVIEESLKAGTLRAIVATSSLELGIDMGAVDLVILVESPGAVARGLQRVGRAGHQVGAVSAGRIFPKFRGDLLECAVVAERMLQGEIEEVTVPEKSLDVLAQQVVALCTTGPRTPAELLRLTRRAWPYRDVTEPVMTSVLDMLSGRYPSSDFAELRPRLNWDRARDLLEARPGARMLSLLNAGTIPDRGNYAVYLAEGGPRLGELDEEMVYESREGDTFMLGASTWRVESITRDRVTVTPAPGEPGRLPFWHGDGPGRPVELGRALGRFVREVGELPEEKAVETLMERAPLDALAAGNLAAYLAEQKAHTGTLPTDRDITVERFRDELGDWRVCILSPFGARVHAPWATALQRQLAVRNGFEVEVMYTDDGIVLRLADVEELPSPDELCPAPEDVEELVTEQVGDTALFAGLFRENAARSLLLPRRRPDKRNPLWAQRIKSQQLLATVRQYPSFPVVLETYRQCLRDVFDVPALESLLRDIRSRKIRLHEVETPSASPFARSLVFSYVAAFLYEQDAPLAERKAQALTLDRSLLAELLGQAELRELLDADILAELEAELQGLAEERRATDADDLHDLLRRVGDLTTDELGPRTVASPARWLESLVEARRVAELSVAGERRWVAVEDVALYRDAVGSMPPSGLPDALLDPVDRPLEQLVRRWARTHGPFHTEDVAARYGLRPELVRPVLETLLSSGVLVRGEIRPGGVRPEWCDAEVLRRLKRRTLAALRNEVAPVPAGTLGRFLPQWQGLDASPSTTRLEEALVHLEGLPLSWSLLSTVVLPSRVPGFHPRALDERSASGELVWVGRGALGQRDGRVALYRRDRAAFLLEPPTAPPPDERLHRLVLEQLEARGASFFADLQAVASVVAPGTTGAELESALWDLVWDGRITNDTFAPLMTLGGARGGQRRVQPLAGGRWSLTAPLILPVSDTERIHARVSMLLDRYGVVSRDAALTESLPGGWGPHYRVLRAMEEAGRVRRGHFVEDLGGAQFALPGVVDRLREEKPARERNPDASPAVRALPAADPANPWGALFPWPPTPDRTRPRRVPGAFVVLVDGSLALYLGAGGRRLSTFPSSVGEADLAAAWPALASLPRAGRRRTLIIEQVDGVPARESPHAAAIVAAGFERDYRGLAAPVR